MVYYIMRLQEYPLKDILIPEVPIQLSETDEIICFLAGTLQVIGIGAYKNGILYLQKTQQNFSLKETYSELDLINEVTPRTYKLFSKRIREINEHDFLYLKERCLQ